MILKPQDIFTVLKLIANGKADWSYAKIAVDLDMADIRDTILNYQRANGLLRKARRPPGMENTD